jgi:uncharacterized membrane protein
MPPRHALWQTRLQILASVTLVALIFLCLFWELWWAPIRPGGSWLAAKAFPLLLPLFGILNGRRYSYQVSSLLALLYLLEGAVRASSDSGLSRQLALLETLLALLFFASVVAYARLGAPRRQAAAPPRDAPDA